MTPKALSEKEEKTKVEVGQIYEVSVGIAVLPSVAMNKINPKRKIFLEKGEFVEVRYPYEWHCRTVDNIFFHISPEDLSDNFTLYGKVWDNVKRSNVAELGEIIKIRLFDKLTNENK